MTALLFIDTETTGPTPQDTILEVAWTITDLNGTQRLPIRSRYSEISTCRPVTPQGTNGNTNEWTGPVVNYGALTTAENSGLFTDWLATPQPHRLRTGSELERLLLDDITAVCPGEETVHISGCGVAQFDQPLLREHCPWVVYPQGVFGGPTHYRPVDQSSNLTGLLGQNASQALITRFITDHGVPMIRLADPPQFAYRDTDSEKWFTTDAGVHRAAPDVARSMVLQRVLWDYGAQLREDYDAQLRKNLGL